MASNYLSHAIAVDKLRSFRPLSTRGGLTRRPVDMETFLRVLGLMLLGVGGVAVGLELFRWPLDRAVLSFSGLAFLGNVSFFVVGGTLLLRRSRWALLAMMIGSLPLLYSQFLWHHMFVAVGEHTIAQAVLAFALNGAVLTRVLPLCVAIAVFAWLGRLPILSGRTGPRRSAGSA